MKDGVKRKSCQTFYFFHLDPSNKNVRLEEHDPWEQDHNLWSIVVNADKRIKILSVI